MGIGMRKFEVVLIKKVELGDEKLFPMIFSVLKVDGETKYALIDLPSEERFEVVFGGVYATISHEGKEYQVPYPKNNFVRLVSPFDCYKESKLSSLEMLNDIEERIGERVDVHESLTTQFLGNIRYDIFSQLKINMGKAMGNTSSPMSREEFGQSNLFPMEVEELANRIYEAKSIFY